MQKKQEWFYDDDFWEQYASVIFNEERLAEVPSVANGVIQLASLNMCASKKERGKFSILDLCCGYGRIALELSRIGFNVTGVDITENYLKRAKKDAAREKLNISFFQNDVRTFELKNSFDAALNLYNSFGYFENPDDDLLFATNAYSSLKEGGSFVIDVLGKEIAVRDHTESEWLEMGDITFLAESSLIDSCGSIKNRWIIFKDGKQIEKIFTQRLYSASELRALLLRAGFSSVELYGDWDCSPYDIDAKTLIAVGRKN